MKKINILKENKDYNRIIQTKKPFKYKDYIIYIERGEFERYEFGFSVGKKIGNAVTRNKIKRRIKNVLDTQKYKNNFKCIILVGKGILNRNYQEMEFNLIKAISKLGIMEENNEKK